MSTPEPPTVWWSPEYQMFYALPGTPPLVEEVETRFMPSDIQPMVPDTGQPSVPANECPECRGSGRVRPLTREEIAEQTAMTIDAPSSGDTGQARPVLNAGRRIVHMTSGWQGEYVKRDSADPRAVLVKLDRDGKVQPVLAQFVLVLDEHGASVGTADEWLVTDTAPEGKR